MVKKGDSIFLRNNVERLKQRLKKMKKLHGFNQSEFAKEAGVSECGLSLLLNHRHKNPRFSTLDKIEAALSRWENK